MSWDELLDQGKFIEAISEIRKNNKLTSTDNFHIGQCYAYAGNKYYVKALEYFSKSYKDNEEDWNNYVEGTICFIKNDIKGLKKHIALSRHIDYTSTLSALISYPDSYKQAYDSI